MNNYRLIQAAVVSLIGIIKDSIRVSKTTAFKSSDGSKASSINTPLIVYGDLNMDFVI